MNTQTANIYKEVRQRQTKDVNETRAFETETETETRAFETETETIKNWSRDVSRQRPVSRLLTSLRQTG